ncbi:MAG TPA: MASE4 domain-containing protein [Chloroflexia bacterium]|nr:MASE4 domain-containing protein [Chloroflexia bacterium]
MSKLANVNRDQSLIALKTTPAHRRTVLALALLLTAASLLALPFAQTKLPPVQAFIPMFITALFLSDLFTAFIFWTQFRVERRPAIAALSATYLFTGLLSLPYLLAFPGALAENGLLGASNQTPNWLWIFWHTGFPLGILVYLLVDQYYGGSQLTPRQLKGLTLALLAGVAGLLAVISLLAFPFQAWLPELVEGNNFSRLVTSGIGPLVWLLNAFTVGWLVWRTRGRTVVQLWLTLGMLAWLLDVTLILTASSRYTVGWYMGRVNMLVTSGVIVGALLYEVNQLYRKTQEVLLAQQTLDRLKDEFISVASHELRTPLTAIKGYTQMLEHNLQSQLKEPLPSSTVEQHQKLEKQIASSRQVLRQVNRMQALVERLLDFSRIQNSKLALELRPNVRLGELVERVVERQHFNAGRHRLLFCNNDSPLLISCDELRLEQVFDNLINNAFKYSPPGTTVTVSLCCDRPHRQAVVTIKDEGQGISAEDQAHLFEQFFRVQNAENREVEGLGLGLYISYSLVQQHGGRLWVERSPGRGSIFYVALPLQSEPSSLALEDCVESS